MSLSRPALPFALSLLALSAALAPSAQAASVSFTQVANGNVLVQHDNNDWQSFSFSSTGNTAVADATLFKFSNQGSFGNGTEVVLLKNGTGDVDALLTANVTVLSSSSYKVHYEFMTGSALPSVLPTSTGQYSDVIGTSPSAYVGLQSFSQGIGLTVTPSVPEPATYGMALAGLLTLAVATRRKR